MPAKKVPVGMLPSDQPDLFFEDNFRRPHEKGGL